MLLYCHNKGNIFNIVSILIQKFLPFFLPETGLLSSAFSKGFHFYIGTW